jgi:hypothetical protein
MPQKYKKKPQELQVFRPVFTSAKNLEITASTPSQVDPIPQNTSNLTSSLKEKLDFYRQKAKVPNTEKSTRNWIIKFEEFRKEYNYITPLEQITDSKLIESKSVNILLKCQKRKILANIKQNQ